MTEEDHEVEVGDEMWSLLSVTVVLVAVRSVVVANKRSVFDRAATIDVGDLDGRMALPQPFGALLRLVAAEEEDLTMWSLPFGAPLRLVALEDGVLAIGLRAKGVVEVRPKRNNKPPAVHPMCAFSRGSIRHVEAISP